jgi:rare lipoprotein A
MKVKVRLRRKHLFHFQMEEFLNFHPSSFIYSLVKIYLTLYCAAVLSACATSPPLRPGPDFEQVGTASFYAKKLHGRRTASGEHYNPSAMTAAHPSLPFGTIVMVKNTQNNRSVNVRINDRGPHSYGRIIDLSYAAAKKLGMINTGIAHVRISIPP